MRGPSTNHVRHSRFIRGWDLGFRVQGLGVQLATRVRWGGQTPGALPDSHSGFTREDQVHRIQSQDSVSES
jgi:hypothetical protein